MERLPALGPSQGLDQRRQGLAIGLPKIGHQRGHPAPGSAIRKIPRLSQVLYWSEGGNGALVGAA
jgi:hypothetical protein